MYHIESDDLIQNQEAESLNEHNLMQRIRYECKPYSQATGLHQTNVESDFAIFRG